MAHKTDPIDALHADLLASQGGIAAAARLIGRSPQVLYNKLSESMPNNELTGREERALADAVKSRRYIAACCAHFGGVFVTVPQGGSGDDDLLETYLAIIQRMGKLSADLTSARADGVIDHTEFERLREDGFATMAAIQTLLSELETMVREIPSPIPLRSGARRS